METVPAIPATPPPRHPAADRLRTGEPVSTVLQDDVRETLQQANDRGIFPVADCVRILQAADHVAARQATRDGTPHHPLLPENFHQLTPDAQAAVVREQMPRLFNSEILRAPQDGTTGPALPPGFISQNQSAISQHAGERAAGKFRTFTTALRALRARLELSITQVSEGGIESTHRRLPNKLRHRAQDQHHLHHAGLPSWRLELSVVLIPKRAPFHIRLKTAAPIAGQIRHRRSFADISVASKPGKNSTPKVSFPGKIPDSPTLSGNFPELPGTSGLKRREEKRREVK